VASSDRPLFVLTKRKSRLTRLLFGVVSPYGQSDFHASLQASKAASILRLSLPDHGQGFVFHDANVAFDAFVLIRRQLHAVELVEQHVVIQSNRPARSHAPLRTQ